MVWLPAVLVAGHHSRASGSGIEGFGRWRCEVMGLDAQGLENCLTCNGLSWLGPVGICLQPLRTFESEFMSGACKGLDVWIGSVSSQKTLSPSPLTPNAKPLTPNPKPWQSLA